MDKWDEQLCEWIRTGEVPLESNGLQQLRAAWNRANDRVREQGMLEAAHMGRKIDAEHRRGVYQFAHMQLLAA